MSCIVFALLSRLWLAKSLPYPAVWNFSTSHLDAFALGVLIATNYEALRRFDHHRSPLKVFALGGILLFVVISGLNFDLAFVSSFSSITYLFAALIFGACVLLACFSEWSFKGGGLSWLGKRSYGLYVFHYPVIFAVQQYSKHTYLDLADAVLIISLSLLLTAVSFRFLESPFLALKTKFQ